MKNNFSDWLIDNPGTCVEPEGLVLEVRMPWYRALPLSVVEVGSVAVDGGELPLQGAEFEVNGKRFALGALAHLTGEWWFVQDSAFLHVPAAGVDAKAPHQVELLFTLYPPYIPMLTWATRGSARVLPQTQPQPL